MSTHAIAGVLKIFELITTTFVLTSRRFNALEAILVCLTKDFEIVLDFQNLKDIIVIVSRRKRIYG